MAANTLGITVNLSANTGQFTSQMNNAAGNLSQFQVRAETMASGVRTALGELGIGASIAGITHFVRSGIDAADALNDMSLKTGISVEKLSGFQLATKQSGTDMDAFTAAANKLSVNMGKNGEEFAKLGITAKDPAEAFIQLAGVMSGIDDPQQRAALGAKALGKSWAEMAPLLLQGGDALRASIAEGTAMIGITTEMAHASDEFNDRLEKMHRYLGNIAVATAGPVINGFNIVAESIGFATDKGITFNNIMRGIGDVVFNRNSLTGLDGDLQRITEKIEAQEKRISAIRGNGVVGGLIDSLAGTDINLEKNRLASLYKEQGDIFNKVKALPEPVKKELAKPSNEKLAAFISGGAGEDGIDGKKSKAKKDAKDPLAGDAASIFERTRTPLEKYNEQMAKLNKLLTAGAINQDTFARASLQAGEAMAGTSDKTGKLTEAQQGQIDSLQTSLTIAQNQSAKDAWSGKSEKVNGKTAAQRAQYLQNRIAVVSGKMPALDQNGNSINFENLFPSNNPPLQDQSNPESIDKQAPQIINPLKIKEDETIKNFMNLNQRLSDLAAANPIIQPIQIQAKNDSSLLNIDLASLSAGTR